MGNKLAPRAVNAGAVTTRTEVSMPDESTRLIPVAGRAGILAWALVDASDYEEMVQHRWNLQTNGHNRYARRYVYVNSTRRVVYMHRQILGLGPADRNIHTDHINGNGLDNRRVNLRRATSAQNSQNRQRARPGVTSDYRGVCWNTHRRKWIASAMVDGDIHYLGGFASEEEAAAVVSAFRAKHMPFSSDAQRAA